MLFARRDPEWWCLPFSLLKIYNTRVHDSDNSCTSCHLVNVSQLIRALRIRASVVVLVLSLLLVAHLTVKTHLLTWCISSFFLHSADSCLTKWKHETRGFHDASRREEGTEAPAAVYISVFFCPDDHFLLLFCCPSFIMWETRDERRRGEVVHAACKDCLSPMSCSSWRAKWESGDGLKRFCSFFWRTAGERDAAGTRFFSYSFAHRISG